MPVIPALHKKKPRRGRRRSGGVSVRDKCRHPYYSVTLFDAQAEIGGQFNIAKQIPGKEEFYETLRYYRRMIALTGVELCLNQRVSPAMLTLFDEVVLACGIEPRIPPIPGIDHPKVLSYLDVLRDKVPVGESVAIIGCGGIGFDTAMYLSQPNPPARISPSFAWNGVLIPACKWGRAAPGRAATAKKAHAVS